MKEVDPASLVPAVVVDDEFAAETKAEVLRSEGIEAFVFAGERSWTGNMGIPGYAQQVPVLVKREDVDRAREILERRIADSVDLDWDEVDVGEREDSIPLHAVGHVPWPAKLGLMLGLAILALAAVAVILIILL